MEQCIEDIVLDEVALDGLSGITLSRLWTILENRQPPFPLKCDEFTKNFLWEHLSQHEDITLYTVPCSEETKKPDKDSTPSKKESSRKGISTLSPKVKHKPNAAVKDAQIDDPDTKDRGFCPCYKTRLNVTDVVRKGFSGNSAPASLQEVTDKWGDSLVLVACQKRRLQSMLPPAVAPDVFLQIVYYCVLEYVGRMRWSGTSQAQLMEHFSKDSSYVFHNCKQLAKWGLLIKVVNDHTSSVYLSRFKPALPFSLSDYVGKAMVDFLSHQPGKSASRQEVVDYLLALEDYEVSYIRVKKVVAMLKANKLIESYRVPLKELPLTSAKYVLEREQENKETTPEEMDKNWVCCFRLIAEDDCKDHALKAQGAMDDDDDDEEEAEQESGANEDYYANREATLDETDLEQVYHLIEREEKGTNGVTIATASKALHLDFYKIRYIIKKLRVSGAIKQFTFEIGRCREMRFCTQKGLEDGTMSGELQKLFQQQGGKIGKSKTPRPSQGSSHTDGSTLKSKAGENRLDSSPGVTESTNESEASSTPGVSRTLKQIQRKELVIEKVKSAKAIELHDLYKHVRGREKEFGYTTEMCRKSLYRMVDSLTKEGVLKFLTRQKVKKKSAECSNNLIKVVCDGSIDDDHPLIQAAFDQSLASPAFKMPTPEVRPKVYRQKPRVKKPVKAEVVVIKRAFHIMDTRKLMELYGYAGKMIRIEILHKFLWYQIYGHQRSNPLFNEAVDPGPSPPTTPTTATEAPIASSATPSTSNGNATGLSPNQDQKPLLSDEDPNLVLPEEDQNLEELLQGLQEGTRTTVGVYANTDDWRRYVPPAQFRIGLGSGWSTINTIIFSLPLTVLLQLVSMVSVIPGLTEFVEDPKRRHYTLFHLPSFLVTELRKQHIRIISSIYTCLQHLSGMGLLYFDDTVDRFQKRMQTTYYLSKTGFFQDTTLSAPGFSQVEERDYPRRVYSFNSLDQVEQFWMDLRLNCLSTPLGVMRLEEKKDEDRLKDGRLRASLSMEVNMQEVMEPPPPSHLPGNHRGAAGLDSSYFGHRKINWERVRCKYKTNATYKKKKKEGKEDPAKEAHTNNIGRDDVKVIKVSAKDHKKNTVGGKGQKRKPSMTLGESKTKSKSKSPAGKKATNKTKSGLGKTGNMSAAESASMSASEATAKKNVDTAGPAPRPESGPNSKTDKEKIDTQKKNKKKTGELFFRADRKEKKSHLRDQKDLVVNQRKVLRRVKWSSREDNMLLLYSLTQKILAFKCHKAQGKTVFVPWTRVRDMLQERLKESYDKTSPSLQRRVRHLMKDQVNHTNFSVCLGDIRADKSIMSDFMSRKGDYTDPEVCAKEFSELCERIGQKFESSDKSDIILLPTNLRELYDKYQVVATTPRVTTTMEEFEAQDVASVQDIVQSILFKVVLISMLSHHFKQQHMKEIYYVLKQYDQRHLERAVERFKAAGYMGRNRTRNMELLNTSRAMPIVPMSFQFTETFFRLLSAPAIPSMVIQECTTALTSFLSVYEKQEAEMSSEHEDDNDVQMDKVKGNITTIVCLTSAGLVDESIQIPRDILSLDISESAIARLEKEHEEEMKKGMGDDDEDFEEEDEEEQTDRNQDDDHGDRAIGDDDGGEQHGEEVDLDDPEGCEKPSSRKTKRFVISVAGRRSAHFVRTAHKEWKKQEMTEKQSETSERKKSGMQSLIPRLLVREASEDSKEGRDSSPVGDGQRTERPEEQNGDADGDTRQSFTLDHDYLIQTPMDVSERAAENAEGMDTVTTIQQQKGTEATPTTPKPSEMEAIQAAQKQGVAEESGVRSEELAASSSQGALQPAEQGRPLLPQSKSDSFFNWLAVRGILSRAYDKKPQSIQDELMLQRCSISLRASQHMVTLLREHLARPLDQNSIVENGPESLAASAHQRLPTDDASEAQTCTVVEDVVTLPCNGAISEQESLSSTAQETTTSDPTESRTNPQPGNGVSKTCKGQNSEQKSLKHPDTVANVRASRRSGGVYHTIGEMLHCCYQPFRPFRLADTNCVLRLEEDYSIREPRRNPEEVFQNHNNEEHLCTLYQLIRLKGEPGATYAEVFSSSGLRGPSSSRDAILRCIGILLQEQMVVEVGSTVVRLVAVDCASKWLIRSLRTLPGPAMQDGAPNVEMDTPNPVKRLKGVDASISSAGVNGANQDVRDETVTTLSASEEEESQGLGNTTEAEQNVLNECPSERTAQSASRTTESVSTGKEKKKTNCGSNDSNLASLQDEVDLSSPSKGRKRTDDVDGPQNRVESSSPSKRQKRALDSPISMDGEGQTGELERTDVSREAGLDAQIKAAMEEAADVLKEIQGRKRKHQSAPEQHINVQYKSVTFVCHSWTNIDSSTNNRSLAMFMDSVTLMIISKPGIRENDLFHHYMTALSPVECLHLLKMLVNAGVITRQVTYTTTKLSLFADSSATKPRPTAYYQPTAQALLNLALLKQNLLPHDNVS